MFHPQTATSPHKGDGVGEDSGSCPSPLALHVPPPEHAWTGVGLARTLGTAPAAAAAPTTFSFPFNAAAGRPLPSFAALLPTPLPTVSTRAPHQQQQPAESANAAMVASADVACRSRQRRSDDDEGDDEGDDDGDVAVTVATPPPPRPARFRLMSKTSIPSVSASGATTAGYGDDRTGAGASIARQLARSSLSALSPSSSAVAPAVSATNTSGRSRTKVAFTDSTSLGHKTQSPVASSFTDLFVGLERPRRRTRRPRELVQKHQHQHRRHSHSRGAADDVNGSSISTLSSPSISVHQRRHGDSSHDRNHDREPSYTNSEEDMEEDTTEDEGGANTPTVYRSILLPHWWRGIVAPTPGTRVRLRPDTRRLEFWWIDRLGSEAYEIIRVILRHGLEGVVLRRSGEAAVVVEFRIPPSLLQTTSYAVARRPSAQQQQPSDSSPTPADDVGVSESPSIQLPTTSAAASAPSMADLQTTDDAVAESVSTAAVHQRSSCSPTPSISSAPLDGSTITLGHVGSHRTLNGDRDSSRVGRRTPEAHPQLPELVCSDVCTRGESSRRAAAAEPATTATTPMATTVTTTVATMSGVHGGSLAPPLRVAPSMRLSTAELIPASPPHLSPIRPDVPAVPSSTLSPTARPSLSLTGGGSTAATVAGRSTDSSVEQDVHWRALARVLDTTVKPAPHPQQRQQPLLATELVVANNTRKRNELDGAMGERGRGGGTAASASCSIQSKLAAAVPLMRRLVLASSPVAERPDRTHDTSSGGCGEESTIVSVSGQASSMIAHSAPSSPPHPRPVTQPTSPRYRLPLTVKVNLAAANGVGGGSSQSCTTHQHPGAVVSGGVSAAAAGGGSGGGGGGDGHLPSISCEEGAFLVHVGPHHRSHDTDGNLRGGRGGGGGVISAASPTAHPLHELPPSVGCNDPLVPGHATGDVQHGGRGPSPQPQQPSPLHPWPARRQQQQQSHHQHPLGSSLSLTVSHADTTAEAAAAAAEAARLEDATAAYAPTTSPLIAGPQHHAIGDHDDDDTVVAVLTLPVSVCTPVLVVRLHAMALLHPLLRAISVSRGTAASASFSDNSDAENTEEALLRAAQLSSMTPPSLSSGDGKAPDYAGAIRIFGEAIEQRKVRRPEAPRQEGRPQQEEATAAAVLARDLSILYTVRSHLLFHTSAACLHDSLQDGEAAMRCCPSRDHVNATYEIVAANLISLGYTSQVEGLAGYLRHRWRAASPLLVRFGRVTQVMVSYASIFLRQQLPLTLLRTCSGGGSGGGGGGGATIIQYNNNSVSVLGGASMMAMSLSAHSPRGAAMVLHSLPGESVPPQQQQQQQPSVPPAEYITSRLGNRRGGTDTRLARSIAVTNATTASTLMHAHTLPYEVCPLLMGHYGKTLHPMDEASRPPLPVVASSSSPSAAAAAAAAAGSGGGGAETVKLSRAFRPSGDVCHRRLFLLETLFPSMNPTPMSRLKPVLPLPVSRSYRGAGARRSLRAVSLTGGSKAATAAAAAPASAGAGAAGTGGSGSDATALSTAVVVPAMKSERRVRAEDFMYDRDSMFALLAATADTTIRWGTVPMRYFGRHIRLSATRRFAKAEAVLMERPALLMPFWPLLPPQSSAGAWAGGAASNQSTSSAAAAPPCCAQCGRQRLARPISCPGGCGSLYCSEQCRELALRLYHVLECGGVPPPRGGDEARVPEHGDDLAARMRRAAAAVQDVLKDWNSYLHHLATWDTPSTRNARPQASSTPVTPSPVSEQQPDAGGVEGRSSFARGRRGRTPPPILAVTTMRVVARLGAMLLTMILPVELLPQMQHHPAWTAERHAMVRAVSRTLRQRGLLVPATATSSGMNMYCTHVDPHRLLLMEVLLQQLSIPFFADFNYRTPSTVWEGLGKIPCEVEPSEPEVVVAAAAADARGADKPVASPADASHRRSTHSFTPSPIPANAEEQQQHHQRNCFVELTPHQREEVLCDLHSMVHRVFLAIAKEVADAPSLLMTDAEAAEEHNGLEWGLPGRWSCGELLAFLGSTRAFQQITDFALTSWAVVYPRDVEPPHAASTMAGESRNPSQSRFAAPADERPTHTQQQNHHHYNPGNNNNTTITNELSSRPSPNETSSAVAVPLVVISPWACLTVDLHPILGNIAGGVIYSRFMVEHEQRRRMLAFCAAAAGSRVDGGPAGNEDSFLSVHSAASTSAAALLSGDESGRIASLREDGSLQLLEEAARRSCSNVHLSLVYTPANETVVVVTAKKNIAMGDVLWWESQHCGDYLSMLL
ncbi:hypothetical protein NESM_000787600 [Novymonas esmeraldas]|uniref:MYND-type domain-containing protein n=1 Tax=Novymonas esmeraldas TaxID=1808958 RepID=A0AAW0EXJ8_9TRYP